MSTNAKQASPPEEKNAEAQETVRREPGGLADWRWYAALAGAWVVIDQLTKLWAVAVLAPPPRGQGRAFTIIPDVFYLRYAENTGAAFSFMTGQTGWLALISVAATLGMAFWWTRVPAQEKWGRSALTIIVAGAVGNLVDRVRLGYVVDFFDAFIGSYDYPVFNVADSLICVGVVVLLARTWKGHV